jgi:tetratricopeptide (TPR) repeat protein
MTEAAPYFTRMAEVHPGEADGYLQSATVFWDYFDFASASAQMSKARERLAQPALFGYQAGAIEESRDNMPGAIQEYVASSLGDKPAEESRERLLVLARRPEWRAAVETETAGLLKSTAPTSAAIELRIGVLDAQQRSEDLLRELKQVVIQTESFDVLDAVTAAARTHALPEVEQAALARQITLTTDPERSLELRYQLVELLQQHNPAAAATEIDAIYREHAKVLGVVRATVDYDWEHERKPQAVSVLLDSANAAYPELKQQFQLEAARKLTELSEYPRAKQILEPLLSQKPLDADIEAALADNYARSGDQAGLEAFYRAELAGVKAATMDHVEKTQRLGQLRRGIISAASLLGNWDNATDQYLELINAYPEDAGLTQEAALAAGAHGLRAKLVNFYSKAVETSPRDARWSIVLARLETALEDYPAAIDAYGKAIRVRPEQKDLYESKADMEERLYKLDDAVADYEQLYKLSYRDPQWKVKVAEARARQGRNADAVKALDDAWIEGRPPRAMNYVEVATRLEQWGLLNDARGYAERCVELAGPDLLVETGDQGCAVEYARVMARLRQSDAAFTRLAIARQQAENVSLSMVTQQVARQGFSAVTDDEWRKQRVAERTTQAKSGFAQALRAMATVVGEYATPEEKAQFAAWLQTKRSTVIDGSELREVYLPAMQAAGLLDMESDLLWEFAKKSNDANRGNVDEWLQLQRKRAQLDGVGAKLESYAASLPYLMQSSVWQEAAGVYRTLGDSVNELHMLDKAESYGFGGDTRYMELLLAARPQSLIEKASGKYGTQGATGDLVAQFLLANGKPDQALAGITTRSASLPAVWKKAYMGLTGLYLRQHTPQVREAFTGALGGDPTIGERIAHPANRDEQLAGEVWFYYGSCYGEYLDEERDAQAEGYLEAELEHTPERASAYAELADYSAQAGRAEYALADYQRSLDLKSDQPAVLDSIAVLEWKQGRQADALAAWQLAVKRLAAELDSGTPLNFWGDFAQVTGDVAKNGQYATISQQVDAMLRVYLKRNGEYRAGELLEAGYQARGDSMEWLLEITTAAHDPGAVLNAIQQSNWIAKDQLSQLLQRRVELERRKAQGKTSESNWSLEQAESQWIDALLAEKKFAEARAELARIPAEKQKTAQWLGAALRLAEAEASLPQLVAQWKKQPANAPASSDLLNAVQALSEPSKRMVMRFVYERALDARELTATNFLGLAAIDLDEGKSDGAVALLKRLKLISGNPYIDADSAASLLESKKKFAEAMQFLQPLAQASPWDANLKVRLANASLAVNANAPQALATLSAVAGDPKAKYAERLAAAKALKGHGAANTELGSAELNLLARAGCPGADEAGKPFFVQARMAAAACAMDKKVKERLLHSAIADSPENAELRIEYVSAAFEAGSDARAMLAAEPIFEYGGNFYGQHSEPAHGASEDEEDVGSQNTLVLPTIKPEDAYKLTWFAIHAREKRHEASEALKLTRDAAGLEKDPMRRSALEKEQQRLETDAARERENAARAPNIHKDMDQNRVVRPRVLPGEPFTPRKAANGEEEEE